MGASAAWDWTPMGPFRARMRFSSREEDEDSVTFHVNSQLGGDFQLPYPNQL
jgi:hypothetical protein